MTNHKITSFPLRLLAGLIALAAICLPVLFSWAQTTATLYTDGTNFGIGTTGPTQKLQVVGTVAATAFSGDGSGLTGVSAGGWTDGGTNVFTSLTTDNVGIGTTTPTSTLEVVKTAAGTAPLMVSSTATADGNLLIVSSSGNVGIGTTTTNAALTIMNGNVGIGSLAPSQSLVTQGNLQVVGKSIYGDTTANYVNLDSASVSSTLASAGSSITAGSQNVIVTTSGSIRMNISSAAGAYIDMVPTVYMENTVGIGTFQPASALAVMNGNVGIGTWSVNDGNSGALIVASGAGNVGIGTIRPGTALDVSGTVRATAFSGDGSGLTGISAGGWTDGGTNVFTSLTTDNVGIGTTTPTSTLEVVKTAAATAPLMISSSATSDGNYFIVSSSGNVGIGTVLTTTVGLAIMNGQVGIGTWQPSNFDYQLLTVNGSMGTNHAEGYVEATAGNAGGVRLWPRGTFLPNEAGLYDNLGDLRLISYDNVAGQNGDGLVLIGPSRQIMLSESGSNVGMGTTFAQAILDVRSQANEDILKLSDGNQPILIVIDGGNVGIGTIAPVGGLTVMNGNVGIGTWNPANRLSIAGNIGIGTTLPYLRIAAPNNGMVIEGNVGIGTWNPNNRFQVANFINFPTNTISTFLGEGAGTLTVGDYNLGVGNSALSLNASGEGNTAVGVFALLNSDGDNNTAVGRGALQTNTAGDANTAVGDGALNANSIGNRNTAVGDWALVASTGGNNIALGYHAGETLVAGANNIIIGYDIDAPDTTISNRLVLGNLLFGTGIDGTGTALSSGNIGVGTVSPMAKFEVIGDARVGIGTFNNASAAADLYVQGNLEVDGIIYGNGSGLTGVSAGGWTDGGTNVFTSATTDNVGIGTTTPTAALLVENAGSQHSFRVNDSVLDSTPFMIDENGNIGVGTTTANQQFVLSGAGSAYWVMRRSDSTTASGVLDFIGNDGAHDWIMGTNYAVGPGFEINEGNNATPRFYIATGGNIGIGTDVTSGTAKLAVIGGNVGIGTWLPVNGLAIMNGNVGIGTWNPLSRLTIRDGNVGIGTYKSTLGRLDVIGPAGSAYALTATPTTPTVLFRNHGSNSDNMNAYFVSSSFGSANILMGDTEDAGMFRLAYDNSSNFFSMQNSSAVNLFIINQNGNVGIGTNSLLAGLAVMTGNVGIGTWKPDNARFGVIGNVGIGTTLPYRTLAAPTAGMFVEGNVGIGTWSPVSALQVYGALTPRVVALTDAATIATDASLGNQFRVTLGGNRTLDAPTNPVDGQKIMYEFIQDGTGSRTITLNAIFALGTDISAVTLSTTAAKRDFMGCVYNATANKWCVVAFVTGY